MSCFKKVTEVDKKYAEAYNNKGRILME